jgi:cellulose biosynthesis protein BcsQ
MPLLEKSGTMIVSFVQTKGGTGKSTLAVNTAFSEPITSKYSSVALVELDPQGTLKNWWQQREEEGRVSKQVSFHHISSTQKEVVQEGIKSIATHNQLLILDIPGESVGKLHTKFACAISDLVVIPMRTSTNDESAFADNLLPIVKELIRSYPEKRGGFYVLPSFTNVQTTKEKIFDYFHDILPEYIGCLQILFPFRGIYENFNRDGMNLLDYADSVKSNKRLYVQAVRAIQDIDEIAKEILLKLEAKHVNA